MSDRDFFNNFNRDEDKPSGPDKYDFDNMEKNFASEPKSLPVVGIAIGLALGLAIILLVGKFLLPSKPKRSGEEIPIIKAENTEYKVESSSGGADVPFKDSSLYEDLSSSQQAEPVAPVVAPTPVVTPPKAEPKKPAPAPKATPAPAKNPTAASSAYYVQVASLSTEAGAKRAMDDFAKKHKDVLGNRKMVIVTGTVDGATKYRVKVGGFTTKAEADKFSAELKKKNVSSLVTK